MTNDQRMRQYGRPDRSPHRREGASALRGHGSAIVGDMRTTGARLKAALRRGLRYRGMLVLVLWQVPIQPVVRPNGSLGLMIGGGTDEHAELSCSGDLLSSAPVKHQVAAVEADYSLNSLVRVDAVAGIMRSDWQSHNGGFGAVQLRGDWKYVGLGAGLALSPSFDQYDDRTAAWPTVYARGGSAEGLHVRLDAFPMTSFATQQIARLGLGYNAVLRDQPSVFLGVAGLGGGEGSTGVAGDVTLPLAHRFALRFEGHYAGGHAHPVSGLAVGGRLLLGGSSRMRAAAPTPAPPVDVPPVTRRNPDGQQPDSAATVRRLLERDRRTPG